MGSKKVWTFSCKCGELESVGFTVEDIPTIDQQFYDVFSDYWWTIRDTDELDSSGDVEIDPIFDQKWIWEQVRDIANKFLAGKTKYCSDCGQQIKVRKVK